VNVETVYAASYRVVHKCSVLTGQTPIKGPRFRHHRNGFEPRWL